LSRDGFISIRFFDSAITPAASRQQCAPTAVMRRHRYNSRHA
jgi:hypothetical protein